MNNISGGILGKMYGYNVSKLETILLYVEYTVKGKDKGLFGKSFTIELNCIIEVPEISFNISHISSLINKESIDRFSDANIKSITIDCDKIYVIER